MGIDIRAYPLDGTVRRPHPGTDGRSGFIQEAHRGGPYPSQFLAREAFANGRAAIPALTLRHRLPETLAAADVRVRRIYGVSDAGDARALCDEYAAFVEFCEHAEQATGKPVMIAVNEY